MTFNIIWLALSAGLLLIPGVARAQEYSFQNISFPGDTFTQLLGINDANVIAGYHGMDINKGFTLTLPSLTCTSENFPNSAQTHKGGGTYRGKATAEGASTDWEGETEY